MRLVRLVRLVGPVGRVSFAFLVCAREPLVSSNAATDSSNNVRGIE